MALKLNVTWCRNSPYLTPGTSPVLKFLGIARSIHHRIIRLLNLNQPDILPEEFRASTKAWVAQEIKKNHADRSSHPECLDAWWADVTKDVASFNAVFGRYMDDFLSKVTSCMHGGFLKHC